ncbi:DcaP family trimeric outer membrane transporter [Roseovarius autotrophicus]|uniref:DcaP family trimeric outer membrane transporter n=1 Tax=Roseovarius autotrophicus TaxID=2824121 RepID=UPI001B37D75B|nr:DcaP family trimeric outer membrane transporter [Roseovarius autotrophicus]
MKRGIPALLGAAAVIGLGHASPALAQSESDLRDQVRELTDRLEKLEGRGHVNVAPGTTLTFGGYTKLDLIFDVDQGMGDTTNVLGLNPDARDDGGFRAHARQTRFNFKSETQTERGPLITFFEIDFFGTANNQVLSNSNEPRLRHAYGQWNGWTAGQTWSTFMPIEVYPNTVDFQGPTGLPFIRQAQLRYTFNATPNLKIDLALENSEFSGRGMVSDGMGFNVQNIGQSIPGTFSGFNSDFDSAPDLVAAATYKFGETILKGAAVLRFLDAPSGLGGDDEIGWGINLAAGTPLWEGGRLVGSFTYGDGVGRYIIDGPGQDGFIDQNGNLDTIEAFGFGGQITHQLTEKVNLGLAYGYYKVDDTFFATDTEELQTVHATLFWKPAKRVTVGAEVSWVERELANGRSADATRLQGSVQFSF